MICIAVEKLGKYNTGPLFMAADKIRCPDLLSKSLQPLPYRLYLPMLMFAVVALGALVIVGILVAVHLRDRSEAIQSIGDTERRMNLARDRLPVLAAQLEQSPNCELSQKELTQICQAFPQFSRQVYNLALKAVASSGGSVAAKTFALNIGRISYSIGRPGGVPTVYDEQAILNDIRVRETSGSV